MFKPNFISLFASLRITTNEDMETNQIPNIKYHVVTPTTKDSKTDKGMLPIAKNNAVNLHNLSSVIFDNPKNLYGFLSMSNNHPFFGGASPLGIIGTGDISALARLMKHLDELREACM